MRLRSAALAVGSAALCTLAPLAARAQTLGTVLRTYTIAGCASGIVRFEPDERGLVSGVLGQVGCFSGDAALTYFSALDVRLTGTLSLAFGPEFTGAAAFADNASQAFFTFTRTTGVTSGTGSHFSPSIPTFLNGVAVPFLASMPVGETAVLSTIRDVGIMLNARYVLPSNPERGTVGALPASLTLTAIPEPSTWAMFGVGTLALAGVTRRKRRPAEGRGRPA